MSNFGNQQQGHYGGFNNGTSNIGNTPLQTQQGQGQQQQFMQQNGGITTTSGGMTGYMNSYTNTNVSAQGLNNSTIATSSSVTGSQNSNTNGNGGGYNNSARDANTQNAAQMQVQTPQQQQQQQQSKELNAASLCRFGQETVQEIVSRTQELYQTLRGAQPPDGKQQNLALDRKPKFQELLRNIRALYKRLRVINDKIGESFPDSEDMNLEESISNLGPSNANDESNRMNEKYDTEAYRLAIEEYNEVTEQVVFKNRHLRETMDLMRHIIWDINTMLAMRKE